MAQTQSRAEERRERNRAVQRVQERFEEEKESFDPEEIEDLMDQPAAGEKPKFPTIIFVLAVVKDLLDIPGELTVAAIVLTTIFSFLISIILFLWTLSKGESWSNRKNVGTFWKRYAIAMVAEYIPFVKMLPATGMFIISIYMKERKQAKLNAFAIEEFKKARIKK